MVDEMEKSQTRLKQLTMEPSDNKDEKNFRKLYYELFNNSTSGIAYHRIIYDFDNKLAIYGQKSVHLDRCFKREHYGGFLPVDQK